MVLPPTLATTFFLSSAPSALAGLCKVPFLASSAAISLGAFRTREGVLIMSRIAKASASAAARRFVISANCALLVSAISLAALTASAFFSAALVAAAPVADLASFSIAGSTAVAAAKAASFSRASSAAFISAS